MQLVENEKYYFDADAAEKPINWIEKYLCHYEERHAGKPFLLLDWQKKICRDVFGWKHRDGERKGLRRFREVYIEIAKGNGKSPFITAISLFVFFYDKKPGKQHFSIATDFQQANITFDMAKKMISASPKLASKVRALEKAILYEARNSKWAIQSGTAEGKHGFRPDVVNYDEMHESSNRKLYDSISANMIKRLEPLMLIATNAGSDKQSICYELHQRSERVLNGTSNEETLYPCIFAADIKDDWSKESTWRKANPSLGQTITVEALRIQYLKAKQNPALEALFRRLNLSQWVQGSTKWLDMQQWDNCTTKPDEDLTKLPCYLGMDLSTNDDFSSISAIFVGKKLHVKSWTYIPRASAIKYEDRDALPIREWNDAGAVRLLQSETVDDDALERIERFILKLKAKYNIKTLGYDRVKANLLISRLEKNGLTCIPVSQSIYSVSPAALELERQLKAGTVTLPNNPCLRWQAANTEVIADNNGLIRPVKEAQKGKYAGKRGAKIDAIVAIINALSEVLKSKNNVATEDLSKWDGKLLFV